MTQQVDRVEQQEAPERSGFGAVVFVVLFLGLLAGAGYVAAYWFAADRTPRGTTVAGVAVGGKTHAEAVAALEDGLADRAGSPFDLTVGGTVKRATPDEVGLAVDYDASVDQAGAGRSWDPTWLWNFYTGGDDFRAIKTVDESAMTDWLGRVAAEVDRPAREGAVTFRSRGFTVTDARDGTALDQPGAQEALRAAYLTEDPRADLPMTTTTPDIDENDVQDAVDAFANPAMSGPVVLRFGSARARLEPADYAPAISLQPQDGRLVPTLDAAVLDARLGDLVAGNGAPVDARIEVVGGVPRVIPSRPGVSYDPDDVHQQFLDLVARPDGQRELTVKSAVARPAFTTRDARRLGIKEQVSTFTTYFPYADYRNVNLPRAAGLIDGTVLKPGETFSLNGTVGERTEANGFTTGWTIRDGQYFEDLGGGVSQIATTTFNAAFFAGMTDVEHKPHSFYIDRYPEGREATVAWGSTDLRFRNDTPYGIYIQESVQKSTPSSYGVVTVSMYSTKYWDITTTKGPRYKVTNYQTLQQSGPKCYAHTGYPGFDVDVNRYWRRAGDPTLVRTEVMHTHYNPEDAVVCS